MKLYSYEDVDNLPEEWIECVDALPPPGKEVVVQTDKGRVTALARFIRWDGGCPPDAGWWANAYGCDNQHLFKSVIRWRPFPKSKNHP